MFTPAAPTPSASPAAPVSAVAGATLRGEPLADLDADLVAAVPPGESEALRREVVVTVMGLPSGRFTPPRGLERALALLVVDGLVTCEEDTAGRPSARLYGPGDVIDARRLSRDTATWNARTAAEIAVLDGRLLLAGRRWPQLTLGWTQRLLDAQHEQHLLGAMRGLPRIEDRLVGFLTHAATRWGRVTPDGYTVELPATHALLGRLVAAQRPTVSLALSALDRDGALRRLPDGRWLVQAPAAENAA